MGGGGNGRRGEGGKPLLRTTSTKKKKRKQRIATLPYTTPSACCLQSLAECTVEVEERFAGATDLTQWLIGHKGVH